MTEQQWLSCGDPQEMLRYLIDGHDERGHGRHPLATDRKLRLFAVACVRQVWGLLKDERSRNAVEIAERFADGLASNSVRQDAWETAMDATAAFQGGPARNAAWTAVWAAVGDEIMWGESWDAVWAIGTGIRPSDLLRDIIGNPFRRIDRDTMACMSTLGCSGRMQYYDTPQYSAGQWECNNCSGIERATDTFSDQWRSGAVFRTAWLARDVISTAQGVYEERIMPDGHLDPVRLVILADALEEAGYPAEEKYEGPLGSQWLCTSCESMVELKNHYNSGNLVQDYCCPRCGWRTASGVKGTKTQRRLSPILAHLRSPGPHVRGCWAVDLILGKE